MEDKVGRREIRQMEWTGRWTEWSERSGRVSSWWSGEGVEEVEQRGGDRAWQGVASI